MKVPVITGLYAAILMLLYVGLSFNVVRLRRARKASFGDAADPALRSAIRAHAHFAEYVPFILLLVAILESSHASAILILVLLSMLLLARLLHPVGMFATPAASNFKLRVAGMVLTTVVMIATELLAIARFGFS